MAVSGKKRQRKLEQKKAKRKSKREVLVKQKQAGFLERLAAAPEAPIRHCLINGDLSQGMATVLISRDLPDGYLAYAQFLADTYCLGIKDCFTRVGSPGEYSDRLENWIYNADKIAPVDARKLLEEAAEYGRGNGFPPRGPFQTGMALFRNFRAEDSTQKYKFGKNGKPFYINGPHETPADMKRIRNTLELHCGPGGYETLAILGDLILVE